MFHYHSRASHAGIQALKMTDVLSAYKSARLVVVGAAVLISGCASFSDEPKIDEVKVVSKIPLSMEILAIPPVPVKPKPKPPSAEAQGQAPAMTLPSSFQSPPAAHEYQVWRCTPAQDLLMAFGNAEPATSGASESESLKPENDVLRIWSRQHAYILHQVVSASGARYQVSAGDESSAVGQAPINDTSRGGEQGLEIWFKGAQATLHNVRGTLDCAQDGQRKIIQPSEAPLLVARGNEPDWQIMLDKARNRLTLTAPIKWLKGEEVSDAPMAESQEEEAEVSKTLTVPYRITRAESDVSSGAQESRVLTATLPTSIAGHRRLSLSLVPGVCFDTLEGTPYPLTTELTLGGKTLNGCGEAFSP